MGGIQPDFHTHQFTVAASVPQTVEHPDFRLALRAISRAAFWEPICFSTIFPIFSRSSTISIPSIPCSREGRVVIRPAASRSNRRWSRGKSVRIGVRTMFPGFRSGRARFGPLSWSPRSARRSPRFSASSPPPLFADKARFGRFSEDDRKG